MLSSKVQFLALVFVGILQATATQAVESDELVIGIFPRQNYTETLQMFNPLAKYLSEKLHKKVKLKTESHFASFWENVSKRRYDIVHYNQYHYLESNKKFGYELILKNEEFNTSLISSVIMVRKDSGINSLWDLKNKKVIFGGGRKAMMSYLIPKKMLQQAGLEPPLYSVDFAPNPPNALLAVYLGRADAAGVGDVVPKINTLAQRINVDEMKIIARSETFPHLAWAVKQGFDKQTKQQLINLLLALNQSEEGQYILHKAKMTGFKTATHEEYSRLLQFME